MGMARKPKSQGNEFLNKLKEDTKKNTLDITRIDMYIKKLQGNKTTFEVV